MRSALLTHLLAISINDVGRVSAWQPEALSSYLPAVREQSCPHKPSFPGSKPAAPSPPVTQSWRVSPRLSASQIHHHSPWAALVLGYCQVSKVCWGQLSGGAGLPALRRTAECLYLWGCPSSASWWSWGAANSLIYLSLLQNPWGMVLSNQVGFL